MGKLGSKFDEQKFMLPEPMFLTKRSYNECQNSGASEVRDAGRNAGRDATAENDSSGTAKETAPAGHSARHGAGCGSGCFSL